MALRKIRTFPDPVLQRVARPVEAFDEELAQLAQDMVETMKDSNGIGLAAPQVGESLRLIVLQVPLEDDSDGPIYQVCNPEIVAREGEACIEEGCLSLPGFTAEVDRASIISLKGQNVDGSPFELEAEGLLAICFQHEMDHLDGKLLVNYVSSGKRDLYRTEMKKRKREERNSDGSAPAI